MEAPFEEIWQRIEAYLQSQDFSKDISPLDDKDTAVPEITCEDYEKQDDIDLKRCVRLALTTSASM